MGSIRPLLVLFGIAVVSGSVIKSLPYQRPFEEYGLPKETLIQKEFPSIGTPYFIPVPIYNTPVARKDCDYPTEALTSRPHSERVSAIEEARTPKTPTINSIHVPPKVEPIAIPELTVPFNFNFSDEPYLPALIEETKPVTIPEAPYLPPLSLPQFPVKVIVGDQAPVFVPENPALPTFNEEKASAFVPEAPVLPPFLLPKPPTRISVEHLSSKPGFVLCFHIDGEKLELLKPSVISEAPVLHPFPLPELPVRVEEPAFITSDVSLQSEPEPLVIPEAPVLPPLNLSKVPDAITVQEPEHIFISEVPAQPTFVEEQQRIIISKAPVLTPFLPPELSVTVISEDPAPFWGKYPPATLVADEPTHQTFEGEKTPVVPKAPVLPPLSLPAFPIRLVPDELTTVFVTERPVLPTFTDENRANTIHDAPVLPPLSLPEVPIKVIAGPAAPEQLASINEVKPLVIPQAPELPPLAFPITVVTEEPTPVFVTKRPNLPIFTDENIAITIPEAPVLPHISLPELPIKVVVGPALSELPAFINEVKPLVIPQAPELPPLVFPIRVVPEEPTPVSVTERPVLPILTYEKIPNTIPKAPVLPPLSLPEVPIKVIAGQAVPEQPAFINEVKPLVIPQAPELPPLAFPVRVVPEEPTSVFVTERPDLPIFTDKNRANTIPKATVLPPFSLPELPIKVIGGPAVPEPPAFINGVKPLVIPQAPELPPLAFPIRVVPEEPTSVFVTERPNLPIFNDENRANIIPEAPVLPHISLPELPIKVVVGPALSELPAFINEVKPLVIPQAPELPPLIFPIRVVPEEPTPVSVTERPVLPILTSENIPNTIPEAPVLPPLSLPEVPIKVIAGQAVLEQPAFINEVKPLVIPQAPELPTLAFPIRVAPEEPTPVFVTERPVLPILTNEKIPNTIPEAPFLPPLSLTELPIKVIAGPAIPELPAFINEVKHHFIPEAPELPSAVPEINRVVVEEPIQAPELPPLFFPETPQHGVITEPSAFISRPALSSSPIVVEAPVQIVVQGSRFSTVDCDTV